ncbi:catalase [Shigella sonnei]
MAFHPGHIVPSLVFTNDPLLQGRFLYRYTNQSSWWAEFHEIPIKPPTCPS